MLVTDLTDDSTSECVNDKLFFPHRSADDRLLVWPFTLDVSSYRQTDIINAHLSKLSPQGKLNDALLDFSINHHALVELSGKSLNKCYHYHPQFFAKLKEFAGYTPKERYDILKSWTHPHSLFSKDFLIFPINVNNIHWYGICCIRSSLVFKTKQNSSIKCDCFGNLPCIVVMDSMVSRKGVSAYKKDIDYVKEYLSHEWLERSCTYIQNITGEVTYENEIRKWVNVECLIVQTPKQPSHNDWDCGVYTIRNCNNIMKYCPSSKIEDINSNFSKYVQECQYSHSDIVSDRLGILSTISTLIEEYADYREERKLPPLNNQYTSEELGIIRSNGVTEIDLNIDDTVDAKLTPISPLWTNVKKSDQLSPLRTVSYHEPILTVLILSEFELSVLLIPKILDIFLLYVLDDYLDINILLIIKRLRLISNNRNA